MEEERKQKQVDGITDNAETEVKEASPKAEPIKNNKKKKRSSRKEQYEGEQIEPAKAPAPRGLSWMRLRASSSRW